MPYLIDGEKCPSCDEGWMEGKGLDCANNCEDKKLEDKHKTATPLMVDHLLPNWGVNVFYPNDWKEPKVGDRIIWGKAHPVSRKIRNTLIYFKG